MLSVFRTVRNLAIAGFFFLLPLIIVLVVITKAWVSLSSVGTQIAGIFGMKSVIGIGGSTVFTGLLLIAACLACGLVARLSFMAAFSKALERGMSAYLPVYDSYKLMAEKKLRSSQAALPYASALVRRDGYWQPAYVIERDANENYVVFLPDAPDTSKGHVLLAPGDQVKLLPSVTANELEASLKALGKGLLAELRRER